VKNVFRHPDDRNNPQRQETTPTLPTIPTDTNTQLSTQASGSVTTGSTATTPTPTPGSSQPVIEDKTATTPPTPTIQTPAKSYSIIDVHECFRCPTIKQVERLQETYNFTIGEKDWRKSFAKGCVKCVPIRKKEKGRVRPDCEFCSRPLDLIRRCTRCCTASYCNSTCQGEDWKSHKDYCKHASKPENKAALARYNQRAQSFETLGMDLTDKAVTDIAYRRLERYELGKGVVLLDWNQLQQLPPGILNLTRAAPQRDEYDDAETHINVDEDIDCKSAGEHVVQYYYDVVKEGDYYPQERGEPALATFATRHATTADTHTGTRGRDRLVVEHDPEDYSPKYSAPLASRLLNDDDWVYHDMPTLVDSGDDESDDSTTESETDCEEDEKEEHNKADTINIAMDTDGEGDDAPSESHALATVAQQRPAAPDLLDSGANRYVFGNTTATITNEKEARVTSLKNISGQPRRIKLQATVQPLWTGGNGRVYSPIINNALIDNSLDFSLLPVSHFDIELHKAILFQNGQAFILRQPIRVEEGEIDARGRLTRSRLYRMDTPNDEPLDPNRRFTPNEVATT